MHNVNIGFVINKEKPLNCIKLIKAMVYALTNEPDTEKYRPNSKVITNSKS